MDDVEASTKLYVSGIISAGELASRLGTSKEDYYAFMEEMWREEDLHRRLEARRNRKNARARSKTWRRKMDQLEGLSTFDDILDWVIRNQRWIWDRICRENFLERTPHYLEGIIWGKVAYLEGGGERARWRITFMPKWRNGANGEAPVMSGSAVTDILRDIFTTAHWGLRADDSPSLYVSVRAFPALRRAEMQRLRRSISRSRYLSFENRVETCGELEVAMDDLHALGKSAKSRVFHTPPIYIDFLRQIFPDAGAILEWRIDSIDGAWEYTEKVKATRNIFTPSRTGALESREFTYAITKTLDEAVHAKMADLVPPTTRIYPL